MGDQLVIPSTVAIAREVDGLEMGVLEDGTAYLTGRALARLCGVAPSSIIEQKDAWAAGKRDGRLARLLASKGITGDRIHLPVRDGSQRFDAYPDAVVSVFMEYYAWDVGKVEALAEARKFLHAGVRLYVYSKLGYRPDTPDDWRHFHERLLMNPVPAGYFSVLRESAELQLNVMRAGLRLDYHTIPDSSIGRVWSGVWVTNSYDSVYGPRMGHVHNYPDDAPQARSNPQEINVYPDAALGEFRRWLADVYVIERLPDYLKMKVKEGAITEAGAKKLLDAIAVPKPKALPPAPKRSKPRR